VETLKVIIEEGTEMYGAHVENLTGVYGAGDTIDAVKGDIKDALALYLENNEKAPDWLKKGQYEMTFQLENGTVV
jgi:predicted RNase H-like HicB family nuclease